MWNKKPNRCHLVLYLFLLYKLPFISFYVFPNGHTTSQPGLTAYTATALHHTWKNTTKSSAPEDGYKVARNMLSNL